MILSLLLSFVLLASVPYALAGEESEEEDMAMAMMFMMVCSSETEELGMQIMACMESIESERYQEIAKGCCPGLEDFSAEGMKNYYCNLDGESIMECHKCSQSEVQKADDREEIEGALMGPLACITEAFQTMSEDEEEE